VSHLDARFYKILGGETGLPNFVSERGEGWVLLSAFTRDQLTTTMFTNCDGVHGSRLNWWTDPLAGCSHIGNCHALAKAAIITTIQMTQSKGDTRHMDVS